MQTFTPFPLRARGTLEVFDAAIKLYKQYFWVLLGWSAIVTGVSMIAAFLPVGGMAALFITPLSIGSVVCCIAAAVRGQNVGFGQCWNFTQPRYWSMLGMHILASIIGSLVIVVIFGIIAGIVVGGAISLRDASPGLQIFMGVVAFLLFGSIATIIATVFMSWMGLVPVVICMEENTRGTAALRRAYDILKGHWIRITTLMALVGLAMLAVFIILGGLAALAVGIGRIGDLFQGRSTSDAVIWLGIAAMSIVYVVLWLAWTPLYYLILSVFYLDIRVRQEALDLEWTAHASAPAPAPPQEDTYYSPPATPVQAYSNGPQENPFEAPPERPPGS